MSLVGDSIMAVRASTPDPPQTLNAPSNLSAAGSVQTGGTLTSSQVYYLIGTAVNQWGETTGSTELGPVTVGSGNNSLTGTLVLPPGALGGRVYYTVPGGAAGSEQQYVTVTTPGTFTILSSGPAGYPPQANSAWLPDTDGTYISCALIYKWLNDGLTFIAGAAGGIEDTTGLPTIAQQLYYQIPGRWIRFNTARYDQWPVTMGSRDYIVYRYNVNGVVSVIAGEAFSAVLGTIFSAFPEPSQGSNTATLTANMAVADSQLTCDDASSFTPMSRIQIDNEVMLFSQVNAQPPGYIKGLIRGMGGTTPATHAIGATIQELKFNFSGFRYSQIYSPGQGALQLDAKNEWEVALNWYMMARVKEKEQAMDEADGLDKKFAGYCEELKKKQAYPITVSQIGGSLTYGRDSGRGRLIVP